MNSKLQYLSQPGPFRAEHVRDGDYYELSNGHAIRCMAGGREHAEQNLTGGIIIATDAEPEWSGVDPGYSSCPGNLRAPDVAVGTRGAETGWIQGAPILALEYASVGQNEEELQLKIADFQQSGTKYIWVVRLTGPRRVEVYELGKPMRLALPGDVLTAPGALRNPVPVNALYDRNAANEIALRNLLQRKGFDSLDEVKEKSEAKGKAEGKASLLKRLITRRFGELPEWAEERISKGNSTQLEVWVDGIFDAKNIEELLQLK